MSHLETLIAEYLEWQGFLVRRNTKVGKLGHGGFEMELDIIGFDPKSGDLVHYEPSLDALTWEKREIRYRKKFEAAKKYIFKEVFAWLPPSTQLRQIAVFINHPQGRDTIAGGEILSVDELMAEIRAKVVACGMMSRNAVPEQYPLLRTLQLSHVGYQRVIGAAQLVPGRHAKSKSRQLYYHCVCGCGRQTQTKFYPGDDSRYKSLVVKVIRGEVPADDPMVARLRGTDGGPLQFHPDGRGGLICVNSVAKLG